MHIMLISPAADDFAMPPDALPFCRYGAARAYFAAA